MSLTEELIKMITQIQDSFGIKVADEWLTEYIRTSEINDQVSSDFFEEQVENLSKFADKLNASIL